MKITAISDGGVATTRFEIGNVVRINPRLWVDYGRFYHLLGVVLRSSANNVDISWTSNNIGRWELAEHQFPNDLQLYCENMI